MKKLLELKNDKQRLAFLDDYTNTENGWYCWKYEITMLSRSWKRRRRKYGLSSNKTKNHATNSILPDGGSEDLSGMRVRPAEEETADMAQ